MQAQHPDRMCSIALTSTSLPVAGMPIAVHFLQPPTPAQRALLLVTPLPLHGIHFSPSDNAALKLLQSVRRCLTSPGSTPAAHV